MSVHLNLPDVSLVMIDTHCPELARLALRDTMERVHCRDVLVFSPVNLGEGRWFKIDKWQSQAEYAQFLWHQLHAYLNTDYMLNIQWDAWVLNPDLWTDEFLDYDYIGAPWGYTDGMAVGNGTGIRSTRLLEFLYCHEDQFPVPLEKEDHFLCRRYRYELEGYGFRWAPEKLAARFAFENFRPSPDSRHFLFHDSMNFPAVLSGPRLVERIDLMRRNPHLTARKKLEEMHSHAPLAIAPHLA